VPKNDKSATRYKIRRKIPDPKYSLDEIVRPHVLKSPLRPRTKEQLAIAVVEAVVPTEAQPFLKWVGGKAQMLAQFDEFFPTRIDRYVEPFIGGGAVFFHLKHRFPQMRAYLRGRQRVTILHLQCDSAAIREEIEVVDGRVLIDAHCHLPPRLKGGE